jgi:hypothetical protein
VTVNVSDATSTSAGASRSAALVTRKRAGLLLPGSTTGPKSCWAGVSDSGPAKMPASAGESGGVAVSAAAESSRVRAPAVADVEG